MKRRIIFCVLFFSVSVTPTHAQEITPALRATLLAELQEILQQVIVLQAQVVKLRQSDAGIIIESQEVLYPTDFYAGDYESAYAIRNHNLKPILTKGIREGDRVLFSTFSQLTGDSFIDAHISEFRIFSDEDSLLGAFVQEKRNGSWILAVNRFDDVLQEVHHDEWMTELLLHEYAHIIFFENQTITDDFIDQFWGTAIMQAYIIETEGILDKNKLLATTKDFYDTHTDMFVSGYAASNAEEDLIESFGTFVTHNEPAGNTIADKKVKFFYQYPYTKTLREDARESGVLTLQ